MDRWIARALALAAICLAAYVAYLAAPVRVPLALPQDAGADAAVDAAAKVAEADAGEPDGGLALGDLREAFGWDGGGLRLASGAPRSVRLGVILVSFQGAEGASRTARAKEAARELAARLAADAKTDFAGAMQRGDNGSSADIGRIPRGVLEPPVEYAVFSLPAGGVSEVLETPRGFWIAKRIE